MPRVTNSVPSRARRKKIFERAKGYRHGSRLITVAKNRVQRALAYAYRDRKNKKRELKSQMVVRLNAVARGFGSTYSSFRHLIKKAGLKMNIKTLAQIATIKPEYIGLIIQQAQKKVGK
jgi:large subunit ribosomal protein L20